MIIFEKTYSIATKWWYMIHPNIKKLKKRASSTVTAQGLPHPVHKHVKTTLNGIERVLVCAGTKIGW